LFNILRRHQTAYAYTLGLIGVLCFAATLPLTTIALADFSPTFITVIRAVIAGVAACIWIVLSHSTRPTRAEIKPLIVSGLGLIFGFPLAMAIGLQSVPSYHGAVVLGILPLVTAGLSVMVHGYRARLGFWVCALAGASLVIIFTLREQGGSASWADLWLVLAALMASSGYVIAGDLAKRRPGPWVICWSLVLLSPISIVATMMVWPDFFWVRPESSLLALLALGLFSMFFGFFAWNTGLAIGGIAEVGQVQLLQLFLTLLWGSILIGEVVTLDVWIFASLVALTVYIGRKLA
jgi:drug/metabolite transporter (DMT)-like permease